MTAVLCSDIVSLTSSDILVSFDAVSLFTWYLRQKCLKENIFEDITALFYRQLYREATENPGSPVIANYFMKAFGKTALSSAINNSIICNRYVNDTFVIWPHGN